MSDRLLRINEAMREVLAEALGDLEDPRLGIASITTVRIARDLRNAKVFFSVIGDEAQREKTLAALNSSRGALQRAVGREVKMHHTPQLEFEYDDSTDRAYRIDDLLREGSGE